MWGCGMSNLTESEIGEVNNDIFLHFDDIYCFEVGNNIFEFEEMIRILKYICQFFIINSKIWIKILMIFIDYDFSICEFE